MGCTVTFHDRIGRERLADAVDPTPIDDALQLVESAVAETSRLALDARACEVELSFVADAEMTRLNFDHMRERGPTDVLSFPLHDWAVEGGRSVLSDEDGMEVARLLGGQTATLGMIRGEAKGVMRQAQAGNFREDVRTASAGAAFRQRIPEAEANAARTAPIGTSSWVRTASPAGTVVSSARTSCTQPSIER